MCQELKDMKNIGIFSKTFVVKVLCNPGLHKEAFNELLQISFSDLIFDHVDINKFLSSSISQEDIDNMVKYLLTFGKVELDLNLINVLEKHNRTCYIDLLFSFAKLQRDKCGLLKLVSYTNFVKQLEMADFIKMESISFRQILDGHIVFYDRECGMIVYKDFIGKLPEWNKFMSILFPSFKLQDKLKTFFISWRLRRLSRRYGNVSCQKCSHN